MVRKNNMRGPFRMTLLRPAEVQVGRYFLHIKSGRVYRVVGFSRREDTLEIAVLYEPEIAQTGDLPWDRVMSEFCDGRFRRVLMEAAE